MNKASVSKKALSVFLSVLMILSCCVTAFPWLADTFGFGLTADAATPSYTNLDNALNTWASTTSGTYQYRNAVFHVAEELQAVLNTFVETDPGTASYSVNSSSQSVWSGLTSNGNFLKDIRDALAGRYTSGSAKYNLLLSLIPAAKTSDEYDSNNPWAAVQTSTSFPGDPLDDVNTETKSASRELKDAIIEYSSLSDLPNSVNTGVTITYAMAKFTKTGMYERAWYQTNYRGRGSYYRFSSKPSKSYSTTNISSYKNDLTTLINYFSARIAQDPFAAFANETQAQAAVDANDDAVKAFWTDSGRWSSSDTRDLAIVNHFGGQYTTIAGNTVGATAFTNAVDTYMAACVDALNYYKCKPYAQNIGQYSLASGANTLDRNRLYFYRDPATNQIVKAFDSDYMTKLQAQTIWNNIRGWLDFIEAIYGTTDGNVTDASASKGLKKLFSVDGYYHTDVINLLTLLEDYYEYYDLVALKALIDGYIADYQIPTEDHVNVSAGTYKFRDNDPDSETFTSNAQIDVLLGLFDGYVDTLDDDDTYSRKLKFYVFGNANFDEDPDTSYVETVRDYLSYEAERRGFVRELAPYISHFTPLIYMNLGSLTVNLLQNRILEDQMIYENVYNYTFVDNEGNQLVDNQGNPVTPQSLGYSYDNNGTWTAGIYGNYNYINVYKKYYNANNVTEPFDFNKNPLARADFLALLGTFNEDVQSYIERLYSQLAYVMATRITDAMNATNDGNGNITITLSNFSIIKTSLERVLNWFTILQDPVYALDSDNNPTDEQIGVYMFDQLKNSCYMYKQTSTGSDGHLTGNFTNQKLNLIGLTINTELGNSYSMETAYNRLKNCGLLAKVETFISQGGLANWSQEHYYNTSDYYNAGDTAINGYKFSKAESYMIRLPYAGDLGRGNNTVENDTYTVTNTMVNNLVTQLDDFLGSNDMTAILSSFIKLDEDSTMITDMPLNEYAMYLIGSKLFTDKIMNTLVNLIFPLITGKLEELWAGLNNMEIDTGVGILGKAKIYTLKSIYQIADSLGLSVYPDTVAALISGSDTQLASAKAKLSAAASSHTAADWDRLLQNNPYVDPETGETDAESLGLNWGIDSVELQDGETTLHWFNRRANNFKHALSTVLSGIEQLLKAVISNITYNQPEEVYQVIHFDGTSGLLNVVSVKPGLSDIKINGINGYSRLLAPIFEALGCSANDIYSASQVTSLNTTAKIVDAILNPIMNLVTDQVAVRPIATILDLLPNLLYFISFNTIDQLLGDLRVTVSGARIIVTSIGSWDITLRAAWLIDKINPSMEGLSWESGGLFSDPNNLYLDLYALLGGNINSLIKTVDISDINDILSVVLKAVLKENGDLEMPIVDVGSVLQHAKLYETSNTAPSGQPARPYIATKAIKSDGSTYNRRYFVADKADMFYDIISWVGKAFQNDSFVNQLVAMITKSNQEQDSLVRELLTGVKNAGPAHFVMGLVEVFQPKAKPGKTSTTGKPLTYMPAQYTWYGTESAENNMQNKGISKFLYVAYQNDWTYVKANTFVENADTIITKLLEQQLKEREVNSFGEWLLSLINLAWSNEAITTVMRLLVTLGNATQNELVTYIIGRFTENGMDLSEWYKAFGYLFPEVVEQPVPQLDENNNPLKDEDGNIIYVQAVDEETGEPLFDEETGDPIAKKEVPASLVPGNPDYVNVFGKLTAAQDPEYEEQLNESGVDANRNKKYIWTYDGTELELGDRQTFQSALSYMLAGGDGAKGGMMPAIDIFLSGNTGDLFPQTDAPALLTIYGSNGYDSAIVPFFEALGMNELLEISDFVRFAESVGLTTNDFTQARRMLKQSEFDSIATEQLKVEYLFNVAFGFLEKIMEPEYTEKIDEETGEVVLDEETGNPVMVPVYNKLVKDILTTVLPSGLYFLQSNGLSIFVRNLLQPVLTLVDALLPVLNFNIDDGTGLNGGNGTPLDKLLNELIGRFVLPLLGKAGDRQIAKDTNGNYLYETDVNGDPLKDADGNVLYIYNDDYGISLKNLSLHAIAGVVQKLLGLNMEPFVYGLDAICASIVTRGDFVDSASECSTDAFWTTTGTRNSFKKPVFMNGAYYDIIKDAETGAISLQNGPRNVNDPANVVTILLSLVLDLVLCEDSKAPVRTMVTDNNGDPVYIVDQNGNTTTMIEYTYTVVDGEQQYYSNAEAIVNLIKAFTTNEIVDMIPMVVKAIRELGFTAAWTITPNWSYFDDIDRAEYDPETGALIRTNRRTTQQLIDEANAMFENTSYALINTPVRTIYYLRYAENFAPTQNLWSRELATYLDTSLSDLVDWVIRDFVAKDENASLGSFLENLLTGEGGFINKKLVNTVNEALYNGIGGAVKQFSELLNIFLSFDVNYWKTNPYTEEEIEADNSITLAQFGADLARLFTPLNEILTWLLSGKEMALFHSYRTTGGYTEWVMNEADRVSDYGDIQNLITIPGGQGYWVALVPLLEALGIQLPMNEAGTDYKFKRDDAGRIYYMNGETRTYADGITILSDVIVAVLSQAEGWLRGEDPMGLGTNVIDCVLNRLANVIYFLNANGLVTLVINLLSPLLPLANAIVPLIFSDLGIPAQGEDEDAAAYETRKFIVLIDELLDELLYTVPVDENGEAIMMKVDENGDFILDANGDPIPAGEDENGKEYHKPILPPSFSIVDLNLYNICEVIKDITGLDINGAVKADFYVNGEDGTNGTVLNYNWIENFFLGEISMHKSANGDMYFRMDFNDEESRADFITILLYTVMDVVNDAITPGTSNNEFFVNILGKTDEKDEQGNAIVDTALGQQKLNDLYNIIHAKVEGYEGYDWFYFDEQARESYYARIPEEEYNAVLKEKLRLILETINAGGYQVNWENTTMAYLLTGYLNYTDTNLWDESTARQVEARFYDIVDLALSSFLGEGADLGNYLTGLLEGMQLYSNKYIVMLGALLGNLLAGIPENVTSLLSAAVPGFDATYWNQYAGKAVEDADHPAGTIETDEDGKTTEYVPLVVYTSKEDFVDAFTALFEPFGYLLDWLLVGEGHALELFYIVDDADGEHYGVNDEAAISIGGANGFKEGLVPLLEALGLTFSADDVNDPTLTGIDCIKLTLNSLLNWVDGILTSGNVIGSFVDLLPNIIYFINANGLTVTVLNTLRSLTNILELASGLIKSNDTDITNLNTLLGLDKKGIDLYDLSFEGICNIVKSFTGLDILKGVSLPMVDTEGHVMTDIEGNVLYQPSYLQQWAIGKVTANTDSALYPERNTFRMDYTYTREEITAFGADWSGISVAERARRMERINIFTVLICSVLDVFKLAENEETLRGWLGDTIYDTIWDILHLTANEINYDPFDWFYFDDTIYGSVNAAEGSEAAGNWRTTFPADGSEYVVKYLDTTPYSLIYKYGYFEYYRHDAGETGNLWNKDSVGYLKDNFYHLIDTVINLAVKKEDGTSYESAAEFISEAWNGVNLYSKKNLYSVGYTIGNLLANFEGVLALALNIVLGVDITGQWDEYLKHRVTEDASLVGTDVKDDDGNVVMYKDAAVKYIANESMNRTAFINALVDIFSPADFLVSWFLVGADTPLEFFYTKTGEAAIKLNGGNGYDEALVPIIEALGCSLTDADTFFANNGGKTGINVVKYVADKLLFRVDAIAASENPVQEIVAMLPNLIYFINANGLSVAVRNFLAPVVSLLSLVNNFVDTGEIGNIDNIDDLVAFALNMLKDQIDVDFDLTALSIEDLSITGVFNILKTILGIDINTAMTFPRMRNDASGNAVVYHDPVTGEVEMINIYEQLAIGKVTRYQSANGRTAFRMDACDDEAALSQIDMIAILMATAVNLFEARDAETHEYLNKAAFVKLLGEKGEDIWDAIIKILNLENGGYVDYDWLFTLRTTKENYPYIDPAYQNVYVSPIDKMSAISGTAGYDKYWTKEMAQYVADNLVKVVNNVLLLIGVSIPGVDGPIESIDDLINSFIPGGNLYTNELLAKLTGLIAGTGEVDENGVENVGLKSKLDEIDPDEVIQGLLKNVLGIDLSKVWAYKGRTNFGFTDGDRAGFVNALAEFLSPVNPLLEWLFTDKSISLFYNADASDLIKLPGGNGYEQAVIPLFEAVFGYDNPNIMTLAQYKSHIASDKKYILIDILNPLLDFVDAALADPLNVVLSRIPAIVYFINSKAADRMVRNLLSPVYQVLEALKTLVDIDIDEVIKGAIGFSLDELDFNNIIELVIGLLPENLNSLSPLIVDAVKEFTIGKVVQYHSHAWFYTGLYETDEDGNYVLDPSGNRKPYKYDYGFTMELDKSSSSSGGGTTVYGSSNASMADLITILLRAVIKWLTMPENQENVVNFLNKNIENEQVRTYVLNAYGVDATTLGAIDTGLIGFRYQPYGVSQMMALLYYVYFAANLGSAAAIDVVGKYGNYWPYVANVLTNQTLNGVVDLSFLSGFITYLNGLVERVNGQNNNGGDNNGNGSGNGTTTPITEENDQGSGGSIGTVVEEIANGNGNTGNSTSLNFFQRIIKWFQDLFARIGSIFGR